MPNVDIVMNNRIFKVTCDEGQEARLHQLASWADERLQMIAEEVGQIGDTRLMLLTLLMTCDELFEMRENADAMISVPNNGAQNDEGTIKIIEAVTQRVDTLNEMLGSDGKGSP